MTVRVAVLSDIHGFNLALETVRADLKQQGSFDEVVVAGDLCVVGPGPRQVLEALQATDWVVLHGNTDLDLVEAALHGGPVDSGGELGYAGWQIGPDGARYLSQLPFAHRVRPAGPESELLIVHANPHNVHDRITPDMSDREVRERLGDIWPAALAFGHYHVCFTRTVDGTLLVDVSAVGNPKNRDLRCTYGILTWDEATGWSAEIRKLDYPLEETREQIFASSLPNPQKVWDTLLRASY